MHKSLGLSLCLLALVLAAPQQKLSKPSRPHIVFFVIDDLGWNDVGFRPSSGLDNATFTIDTMAKTGVIFDRSYTQPLCSPTRSAFLSGRFPFRTGLQHVQTINPASNASLPLDQKTMAELLKETGYRTAAIGKWHLGYARWKNTPTGRGFDSHLGFFQGQTDYYTKLYAAPFGPAPLPIGQDWWVNQTADSNQTYSVDILDDEVQRVLDVYTPSLANPLFMYMAHPIAHVPLQVPNLTKYYDPCNHIVDDKRKTYCAMLVVLDESLRKIVDKLKAKGMWDNTLLVVTTDNGGIPTLTSPIPQIQTILNKFSSGGSNTPLRGGKGSVFEGGVRGVAFINGGSQVIPADKRGTTIPTVIHAVDWLPTFVGMANNFGSIQGVKKATLPRNLDGRDLWDVIASGALSNYELHGLPIQLQWGLDSPNTALYQVALVKKNWKIIYQNLTGTIYDFLDGYFPPLPALNEPPPSREFAYLFDLSVDPEERNNLYGRPQSVNKIYELANDLLFWNATYVPIQFNAMQPAGLPVNVSGNFGPWAPWL